MHTLHPMRCFAGPRGFVYVLRHASRLGKTPHFWGLQTTAGGYDCQIRTQPRFSYDASTQQVSSSYVYSFGSYCVDKQTHKQTDSSENIQRSSLGYDFG